MDNLSQREFYLKNDNGHNINVLEGDYVNGPKVILINIHGIGSHFQPILDETDFDNFYRRDKIFRKKMIKSYALEFQGHGKSDGPKFLVNNFNSLVEDIRVLIDYLNDRYPSIKKFILAESMGANAAIRYCIKYNNIDGIVLLSPMCGISKNIIPSCCVRKILVPLSYIFPNLPLPAKSQSVMGIKNKKYNELKNLCIYNYNGYIKLATGRECLSAALSLPKIIKSFTTPVIALHDMDDNITDPYITQLFIDNCKSKDKSFIPITDSHHSLLLCNDEHTNHPELIIKTIIEWIYDRLK